MVSIAKLELTQFHPKLFPNNTGVLGGVLQTQYSLSLTKLK